MSALPKVSIVIPVYNGSDYVSEAIDSALAQTYPNIEVLAVNDGSNDSGKTEGILRSYGSRTRYLNKPNGGVASALNVGIREMEGVYFSWLSHDDLYLPDKVEVQMDYALKADRPTVYYSDFETIDERGQFQAVHPLPHLVPTAIRPALFLSAYIHGCSLLIPRQAFDEVGLFDESLRTTQDYDLWFRMAVRFPFEHIPKVLVRARLHKAQGTNRLKDHVVQEINDLYQWYMTALTEDEIAAYWPAGKFSYFMEAFKSMEKRGFGEAAGFALNLACEHVGVEALGSYAKEHESQIQTLLNDARQNATLLQQELERIRGSMSWRMTAPLRAGRRVLARLHTVLFRPSLPAPHAPLPDDRTRPGGHGDRSA